MCTVRRFHYSIFLFKCSTCVNQLLIKCSTHVHPLLTTFLILLQKRLSISPKRRASLACWWPGAVVVCVEPARRITSAKHKVRAVYLPPFSLMPAATSAFKLDWQKNQDRRFQIEIHFPR